MTKIAKHKRIDVQVLVNDWLRNNIKLIQSAELPRSRTWAFAVSLRLKALKRNYKNCLTALKRNYKRNLISRSNHLYSPSIVPTMIANPDKNYISPQEYIAGEELSPIKHEYINGQVYVMAGPSDAHVTIAGNLFALLRNHVRGSGCRVYMSDMKAKIETSNVFYYPDLIDGHL